MQTYGDDIDCACMPILAINDGPFLTLVALGASGLADIPIMSLVAALVPIIAGMIDVYKRQRNGNLQCGL